MRYDRRFLRTALAGIAIALANAPAPAQDVSSTPGSAVTAYRGGTVELSLDFAKVLTLQQPARTVIIGNPGIADAALNDERTVVLTARTTGTTNLVLLDENGTEIASSVIRVRENDAKVATVYNGTLSRTYSCVGVCRAILSVGDVDRPHFVPTQSQIGARQAFSRTE